MKNLTKVLLTVIAMFGFSLNVLAFADENGILTDDANKFTSEAHKFCKGYSEETDSTWTYMMFSREMSPYWRCVMQKSGLSDFETDNFYEIPSSRLGFEPAKSHAQKISEDDGLYNLIKDYGLEDGLAKLGKFFKRFPDLKDEYNDIVYHMRNTPMSVIVDKAEQYPLSDFVKSQMRKHGIIASL